MTPSRDFHLSATELLELFKDGDLTVETYAQSLLSRVKDRDTEVRAWAYLNPELIIAEARRLDAIPVEQRGPLHGVAVGVKDVILTKDMPTAHNSPIYKDSQPGLIDAAPIITLRALGALIFGKTTTTEFASTTVGTATRNPHGPLRTPGGSSSGSGAAVADFQVPIALGTQTGGSIVRPGSFCGVYAFKPTWGAISREGLSMYSMTCDTLGLFARSVEDLVIFANAFRLADDQPVPAVPFDVKGKKIAFVRTHVWDIMKQKEGLKAAWDKGKVLLQGEGALVEEIELPPDFANLTAWHRDVLNGEGRASFLGNYTLAKDKLSQPFHDQVDNSSRLSRSQQLEAYDGCARLRPVFDAIASNYDAILTPSVPDVAPIGLDYTGDAAFCSMWTILHVPCLNIPGFAGEDGMPIGLTLVGGRYTDLQVLHAGAGIGKIFEARGGFVSSLV